MLINLLGNAVKFTETGSVTFKVDTRDGKLWFEIKDTGIGIAAEQLEAIFLPFQQVGEQNRQTEGTGLGLAISRQLIEMMGGELKVKSILGKGSVFWFELDLPQVNQVSVRLKIEENNQIIGFQGSKRKILVVGDRWANRSVLVNLLEPLGFELLEATNGSQGLAKAREFQPDLVFMDLVMPEMDGFETTRQLRQIPEFTGLVIIAVSASVFNFDRQQSLEVGCDDFLPKPFWETELLEKLRIHLGLEWIYKNEDSEVKPALDQREKTASFAPTIPVPSEEEIANLLDLAMRGDLRGITAQVDRLEELDRAWVPLATHLRKLAKNFEGKKFDNI